MSESNKVAIRSVRETSYGETPVNSTDWKELRFIDDSLNGDTQVKQSQESRADRNISDQFVVGVNTSGGFNAELHADTYDDYIEDVMCGTWTADVIKIGTTDRSRSFEKQFMDLSGFKAFNFKGMRGDSMEFKFAYGSEVGVSFNYAGKEYTVNESGSLVGTGSVAAVNTNTVINANGDLGSLQLDGAATGVVFQDMTLRVENQLRAINGIGSNFSQDQRKGRAKVSGSINIYLDDEAWQFMAHNLNQTAFGLDWLVADSFGGYAFDLPKLKISGALPARPGPDADVMWNANYTALYDDTLGSSLAITRS